MYETSENYKNRILKEKQELKIYIDNNETEDKYILDFNKKLNLFNNDELCLGCTPMQEIELEIHKDALPNTYDEIKVYSGLSDEVIPMGIYTIQKPIEDDEYTVKIKAVDYMDKLETEYNGSNLTYPKTLLEVLQDICAKTGVELGSTSFLNMDKEISVYDNSLTARQCVSWIAEQAGGYAVIGRDGKLYIKTFDFHQSGNLLAEDGSYLITEDEKEIYLEDATAQSNYEVDINLFKDFEWGDKFKISKVSYEDGIQDFKCGTDENNTVFIDSNNMYIVDKEQVENIFNEIKDIEIYSFEGKTIIDPAYDIGDILIIDERPVIYQGEITYEGKFMADIKSKIQPKTQQESMQTKVSNKTKFRRVQSEINQQEAKITQLVAEQTEQETRITQHTQTLNSIEQSVSEIKEENETLQENYSNVRQDINGVETGVQNSGGNNLIKNSVMFAYDTQNIPSSWEIEGDGTLLIANDTESLTAGAASGHIFALSSKTVRQKINVKLDDDSIPEEEKTYYTFSTKIKKDAIGSCFVKLYNPNEEYIIELAEGESSYYGDYELKGLLPKDNYYIVEFYGSEDSNATFTDNMLAIGSYKTQWTQASGEIMNTQVNISIDGVLVKSSIYAGDYTVMSSLEFAGYSNINGIITKVFSLNKDTTLVKKLEAEDEFKMTPIKIVPITSGEKQGWAFVASS